MLVDGYMASEALHGGSLPDYFCIFSVLRDCVLNAAQIYQVGLIEPFTGRTESSAHVDHLQMAQSTRSFECLKDRALTAVWC